MAPDKRRRFGFLGPQPYMQQALEELQKKYDIEVLRPKSWDPKEIAEFVAICKEKGVESVGGFAQKDAFHHVLINTGLGNLAPSRLSILYGMNKYLMRTIEPDPFFFAPVDPLKETDEEIRAKIPDNEWPFMLKNTSLSLGRGIFKIRDYEQLKEVLKSYREDKDLQDLIAHQNASILDGVDPAIIPENVPPFLAEHMQMGDAIEYCYEGYITPDGKVVHYGLTEEVYLANHQGIGYVTPPVSVDASVATLIEEWVEKYMAEWAKIGYLNQFFNLEFWIVDGAIKLTEMNPRAAHSYHYNYYYCCGASLFSDNFLLAAGDQPESPTPFQKWKRGDQMKYTMIVLITVSETGKISDIIDYDYVKKLEDEEKLLVRQTRSRDDVLKESDLTSAGVMVLQIWMTGSSKQELVQREKRIRSSVYRNPQNFEYPAYWN